jgi:pimeloyl-ACP methyl ester carboxylesterase
MKRIRSWRVLAAAAVTAVITVLGVTAAGTASATPSKGSKPTIVLVHGAWADGSSWSAEVKKLQSIGYTVDVAPNPLRGASDFDYVRDFLSTISGPIVLVAHSYGGFVITNAATGNSNVKALVYIDAFIPDQGQTLGDLVAGSGSALEPALTNPTSVFDLKPYPGAPPGAVDTYLLRNVYLQSFAPDVPRPEAQVQQVSQEPLSTAAFFVPSGPPAWENTPCWVLIGTQDQIIPPPLQRTMAGTAGCQHVGTVKASHVSLVSRPNQVTSVILDAARSVA